MPYRSHRPPAALSGLGAHVLALLPGLLAYAGLAWSVRDFVTDDALITLRYARQLLMGHGITWNSGEDPVEGFSNFSHVVVGALAIALDYPALIVLRTLNCAAVVGLIALVYMIAWHMYDSRWLAGGSALAIGGHPSLAYWSVSGLETASYSFALLAGLWAMHRGNRATACAALSFAAITRFEGAPVIVAAGGGYFVVSLLHDRGVTLRKHLPWLSVFLLGYAVYFGWRFAYFGYPLSNSAYYKSGTSTGMGLFFEFVRECAPLLLLLPWARWRTLGRFGVALAILVMVYVAGSYGMKASVSYMHRFFLPIYAPAVLLAASAWHRMWLAARFRNIASHVLCMATLVCVAGWDLRNEHSGVSQAHRMSVALGRRMRARARVAAFIANQYDPRVVVATTDVGMIGYALTNPIVDSLGLNDEAFTHRFGRKRERYADYILDNMPDIVIMVSKHPTVVKPHYPFDTYLLHDRRFARRYARVGVAASSSTSYHFMVFAHAGVIAVAAQDHRRVDVPAGGSTAQMVDSVARQVWKSQALTRADQAQLQSATQFIWR